MALIGDGRKVTILKMCEKIKKHEINISVPVLKINIIDQKKRIYFQQELHEITPLFFTGYH